MRDTSLEDFLDGEDDETDDTADADEDATEAAVSTYEWSPDGTECAACGTVVQRRWREKRGLVCTDCKEW